MRDQVRWQVGERLVLARRVVAVVAIYLDRLLIALCVHVPLEPRLAALTRYVRRSTIDALHFSIIHPFPLPKQPLLQLEQPRQRPEWVHGLQV